MMGENILLRSIRVLSTRQCNFQPLTDWRKTFIAFGQIPGRKLTKYRPYLFLARRGLKEYPRKVNCFSRPLPPADVEISRSGNGAHVWFFFSSPIKAAIARQFGFHLLTMTMERRNQINLESYDRYPDQWQLLSSVRKILPAFVQEMVEKALLISPGKKHQSEHEKKLLTISLRNMGI